MKRSNEEERAPPAKRLKTDDCEEILQLIIKQLRKTITEDDALAWYEKIHSLDTKGRDETVAEIEYWVGRFYMDIHDSKKAQERFNIAISILQSAYSQTHLSAAIYDWNSWACYDLGDTKGAFKSAEKAFNLGKALGFADPINELVIAHNIACFAVDLDLTEESISYAQKAVLFAESIANLKFLDDAQAMKDFKTALKIWDKERFVKIEKILADPSSHFEFTDLDAAFVHWSILTKVHKVQIDRDYPKIRKTLDRVSSLELYLLLHVDTVFDDSTRRDIHSFLYPM